MNKMLLSLVSLFNPLWKQLGVNILQLQIILRTKLLMDNRRVKGVFSFQNSKEQKNNQEILVLIFYVFFGIALAFQLFRFEYATSGLTLYFLVWMVFIAMTIITDFTEVLIDVRDNYIILPQPVNDRTITIARILHIALYLSKFLIAFGAPGLISVGILHGIGGVFIFSILLLLSILIVLFLVNILYLLMLRVTDAQRFKEIISYLQITFTVLIIGSYYLLPRLIDFDLLETENILDYTISYVLPPAWLAGLWSVVIEGNFSTDALLLAGLAVCSPILFSVLIIRVLAKEFNQKMIALTHAQKRPTQKKRIQKASIFLRYTKLLGQTKSEKVGIEWVWWMTSRSRTFKLRAYPALAIVPIFFLGFVLIDIDSGTFIERFQALQAGNWYVLLIYFCLTLLTGPYLHTQFSEKPGSALIFHSLPLEKPGNIMIGALWVTMVKFFIPVFLIIFLSAIGIWGVQVIDDFILGFFVILTLSGFYGLINYKHLPFSESVSNYQKGGDFFWNILFLALAGVLGFTHYLLIGQTKWIIASTLFFAFLSWIIIRQIRRFSWKQLQ